MRKWYNYVNRIKEGGYMIKRVFCFLLIILMISPITLSHGGRTDSSGGHYNRSTGKYHYHHGYPAHQHINGECPYNFKDKTNSASDSDSNYISEIISWVFVLFGIDLLFLEARITNRISFYSNSSF